MKKLFLFLICLMSMSISAENDDLATINRLYSCVCENLNQYEPQDNKVVAKCISDFATCVRIATSGRVQYDITSFAPVYELFFSIGNISRSESCYISEDPKLAEDFYEMFRIIPNVFDETFPPSYLSELKSLTKKEIMNVDVDTWSLSRAILAANVENAGFFEDGNYDTASYEESQWGQSHDHIFGYL